MNAPQSNMSWTDAMDKAALHIVEDYFNVKNIELQWKIQELLALVKDEDHMFRYWWIEFEDTQANFLREHLDISKKAFIMRVTDEDIAKLKLAFWDTLRGVRLWDSVWDIVNDRYVEDAITQFFSVSGFTYEDRTISRSADEFLRIMNEQLKVWLKDLLEDSLLEHLKFLRLKALELEMKIKQKLSGQDVVFSKLDKSLTWWDIRTIIVDPNWNQDKVTLRLLSAPVTNIDGWAQDIESIVPNEEKLYEDNQDAVSIFARDNGPSVLSYFFWDPPFEVMEDRYHWWNLVLKSGPLKNVVISREDIASVMWDIVSEIQVDYDTWFELMRAYWEETAHGLSQFMEFRIMSREEIDNEIQRREQKRVEAARVEKMGNFMGWMANTVLWVLRGRG